MARLAHPLQSQNDVIGLNEMMVLEVVTFGETKGGDTMGIIKVKPFRHRPSQTASRGQREDPTILTIARPPALSFAFIHRARGQQNAPLKSNET